MNWYSKYNLVKDDDGFTLEIYLNKDMPEFGEDFMSNRKEEVLKLGDRVRNFVNNKFSDIKVNSVKLILGTMVVATIPFIATTSVAAAPVSQATQQAVASSVGKVTASKLNVRTGPSTSNPVMHALWNGNQVSVINESGNWYQIKLSDGRTGWVSKDYVNTQATNKTGSVTASRLNVRTGPSTSYSVMHILWNGNKVTVVDESGDWYKIRLSDGRTGWVNKPYLSTNEISQPNTNQQKVDKVVATAKQLIGTPYLWGGASPDKGFDCSGLTLYVYKQVGYNLNRISSDQARQGVSISRENLQPGDLVFFSFKQNNVVDHVAIYIGNGQVIHSPKPGDTVKVANINFSYWQQRLVTARRIIY